MPPSLRVPRRSDDLSDPDGRPWAAVPSALVALAPIPLVAQPTAYVRAAWRGRAYGRVWAVRAAAAHDGGRLHVRLEWPSTRGAPAEFPDAAAVYRPRDRAAPAETIGSTSAAVELWLWEDGRDGALCLEGHGPGVFRPCPAGTVSARATRGDGRWAVVITGELSAAGHGPDQDRLGVAVWDGAREERAGIGAATPAWIRLDLESRS